MVTHKLWKNESFLDLLSPYSEKYWTLGLINLWQFFKLPNSKVGLVFKVLWHGKDWMYGGTFMHLWNFYLTAVKRLLAVFRCLTFELQEYSITYFLRLCEGQQNTCISFPSYHCVRDCNILSLSVSECSGNSKSDDGGLQSSEAYTSLPNLVSSKHIAQTASINRGWDAWRLWKL